MVYLGDVMHFVHLSIFNTFGFATLYIWYIQCIWYIVVELVHLVLEHLIHLRSSGTLYISYNWFGTLGTFGTFRTVCVVGDFLIFCSLGTLWDIW